MLPKEKPDVLFMIQKIPPIVVRLKIKQFKMVIVQSPGCIFQTLKSIVAKVIVLTCSDFYLRHATSPIAFIFHSMIMEFWKEIISLASRNGLG